MLGLAGRHHKQRDWRPRPGRVAHLMGTVPWRLAMGTVALVVIAAGFLVGPMLPGPHGARPVSLAARTHALPAASAAADQSDVSAPAPSWSPQPAVYGTGSLLDLPVTMSDGTISADRRLLPD